MATTTNNTTYFNAAVIPPPEDSGFYDGETRLTRIVIDSKDRNLVAFPTPALYDTVFEDVVEDVISVTLVNLVVPMSMYLINKYFYQLFIKIQNISYTINLAYGDYSKPSDLAAEITRKLSSIGNFECVYVENSDNFWIQLDQPFAVDFSEQQGSLGLLLGFKNKLYISDSTNIVRSDFRKNYEYNNFLVVKIDNFDVIKSANPVFAQSFAIIPKSSFDLNLSSPDIDVTKHFAPPLPRLMKISVNFKDRFGNNYDFQNMDHRFELLFKTHKQRRKYGNIMKHHNNNNA